MIITAPEPAYTEYKLFRRSEWDNYDFKGRLPNGKWQKIFSNFVSADNWQYASEVIQAHYGVDINTITKEG